jgi:hypothetical protein
MGRVARDVSQVLCCRLLDGVSCVSDANLGRYGVDPKELAAALTADARVHGYLMFLAEPSAAEWLSKELPLGRGVVCMDTNKLPAAFKDMFTQAAAANARASGE